MESISQRVPQGERGPYRWGRGDQPLYGEGQGGERDPARLLRLVADHIESNIQSYIKDYKLNLSLESFDFWRWCKLRRFVGGAVPRTLPGHCLSSKD